MHQIEIVWCASLPRWMGELTLLAAIRIFMLGAWKGLVVRGGNIHPDLDHSICCHDDLWVSTVSLKIFVNWTTRSVDQVA